MKIHQINQGTDEWFDLRKGKMTASHAQAIGNCGKGLDTYIYSLMADYYSTAPRDNYTNRDMERGNELEEQARAIYELETGLTVDQVGFIEHDELSGASPDGLIGEDGGVEIKCKNDTNYFKDLVEGKMDSAHNWQIQMTLLVTGRKWWDYVVYNPNFKQSMIVKRILPDALAYEKIKRGLGMGKEKINKIKSLIK